MKSSLSLSGCQFSENNGRSQHVTKVLIVLYILINRFDEEIDDRFYDKRIELWSVMKAVLPENDDF